MKWRNVFIAGALFALLAAAAPARAVTITGSFGIGGGISYQNFGAGGALAGLDFDNSKIPPPTSPSGGFLQITNATGYFAGLGMTIGGTGQILNISNIAEPNYALAPAGVPITVNNFLNTFSQASGLHFNLTMIPLQPGPTCPASPVCTEGPFILTDSATGVRIDFDVLGNFVNGADSGFYDGSFSFTVAGQHLADIGAELAAGENIFCNGGTAAAPLPQPCSFDANFTPVAAIPEPATLLTFGLGSLALARYRRKKN